MDYKKIYENLIDRARDRCLIDGEYYESHHIVPRCLGGNDSIDNLVNLTAREHFIAHLCLVKNNPGNHKLVKAAVMMTVSGTGHNRIGNRVYEWLRKKHSVAMSVSQSGKGNSQFGSVWVFNDILKENKKVKKSELSTFIATGWHEGRVYDFDSVYQNCAVCGKDFRNHFKKKTCSYTCQEILKGKFKSFEGKEEELKMHYANTKSMNKALKAMGYPGAVSHYYQWAKHILKQT